MPGNSPGKAELVVQGMDQHPGTQIFIKGLIYFQFLRPLDVVTLVFHINTGLGYIEYIQCLHGF